MYTSPVYIPPPFVSFLQYTIRQRKTARRNMTVVTNLHPVAKSDAGQKTQIYIKLHLFSLYNTQKGKNRTTRSNETKVAYLYTVVRSDAGEKTLIYNKLHFSPLQDQ